jgi:hypothetical protein
MKKHCFDCKNPMVRNGRFATGKQRYYCKFCKKSAGIYRDDLTQSMWKRRLERSLISSVPLVELCKTWKVTIQGFLKATSKLLNQHPSAPEEVDCEGKVLFIDGTWILPRKLVLLIVLGGNKVLTWLVCTNENYENYLILLSRLKGRPIGACIDGHRGLEKALKVIYPNILVQRCLVHIKRDIRIYLSLNPKLEAGRELKQLTNLLLKILSQKDAQDWIKCFKLWEEKWTSFLKEKTTNPDTGKWWYTHKKLRLSRSLISNALPYLFTHIGQTKIPQTTNQVEGGINSRLKDLIRIHRGLRLQKKIALVAFYLSARSKSKRN